MKTFFKIIIGLEKSSKKTRFYAVAALVSGLTLVGYVGYIVYIFSNMTYVAV